MEGAFRIPANDLIGSLRRFLIAFLRLGAHRIASQRDATRPGITRVLLGDLALLHDVGSLLGGAGENWPCIQLVVGNDHGGTIFDGLEVARSADPALADRVLLTPQHVDLAALASAYGWEHRLVAESGQLAGALTPSADRTLVEVTLDR